jgi:hypothetical protein
MHMEDAAAFIVDCLRNPRPNDRYSNYGYDVWLPLVITAYLKDVVGSSERIDPRGRPSQRFASVFYDAAWSLCRYGVLRPGIKDTTGAGPADGASADGYSLTAAGRSWMEQGASDAFLADPDRLSQMFDKLSPRFDRGFSQRATEAVRCHRFGAYLGCCAMCGAAAESILLAVAITKSGNEQATVGVYKSSKGRRRVIDQVVSQARVAISEPFRSYADLLSYWRDEAAHGLSSTISEVEAHTALARLLRFAQFSADNWQELTGEVADERPTESGP